MAQPSIATYDTNGWCRTGRLNKVGDYFTATLRFEANGTVEDRLNPIRKDASGKYVASFAGAVFTVKPVYTWEEYPSGIFEVVWQGGIPIAGSDATVKASYDDHWVHFWTSQTTLPYPSPEPTIHPATVRYLCELWTVRTGSAPNWIDTTCYWLSDSLGHVDYSSNDPGLPFYYHTQYPAVVASLEATIDFRRLIDGKEQVDIEQSANTANPANPENWWWPHDDDPHQWMGEIDSEFRMVSNETAGSWISDGLLIDGVSHRRPSLSTYGFSRSKTLYHQSGMTTTVDPFGYGLSAGVIVADDHLSDDLLQFCSGTIGLTDMDLRLGRDADNVPIQYVGTSVYGGKTVRSEAEDNELRYYSCDGCNGYGKAQWTDLGVSVRFEGDVKEVSGRAFPGYGLAGITPQFIDQSGHTWEGATSPTFVWSGAWRVDMYGGDGTTRMTTHAPETDWVTDHWQRSELGPTEFYLRLTNPEDFATSAFDEQVSYDDEGVTKHKQDSRVLMQYPRDRSVITFSTAEFTIDAMTNLNGSGIGGWAGVNCTLALVGGKVKATAVGANAYLYRADFLISSDAYRPKHWPFYRFCNIKATVTNGGTSDPADYGGSLVIKRTQGQDTFTKTFEHEKVTLVGAVSHARYDTCRPANITTQDVTQSGIEQMQAQQTEQDKPYMELSATSWSWGILGFDRVEIALDSGKDYLFDSLTTLPSGSGIGVEVEREWNSSYDPGSILTSSENETYITQKLYRGAIVNANGRWCAEIPAVRRQEMPVSGLINYENRSLNQAFLLQQAAGAGTNDWYMFPPDTFASWTFASPVGLFNPAWWDAVAEEYTTEDALFAADCCPVGFLQELHEEDAGAGIPEPYGNASYPRDYTHSLYARPLYDKITPHNWFGDGRDNIERQTCIVLRFFKRFRSRIQGIGWAGDLTPEEVAVGTQFSIPITSSENEETVLTDDVGHFRSTAHKDKADIAMAHLISLIGLKSRRWYRVCDAVRLGVVLAVTQSVSASRVYALFKAGADVYLRIFDSSHGTFQDRLTGLTIDTCRGITIYKDNADKLVLTYEASGTIYRVDSEDDGLTWGTPVSIATGTQPSVFYSVEQHVEMTGYINTDSPTKACVRTKLGDNAYGAEVEIAEGEGVAVTYLNGDLDGQWVAMVSDASNNITRYLSKDQGATWSIG